jgi:hypothetical protein
VSNNDRSIAGSRRACFGGGIIPGEEAFCPLANGGCPQAAAR